MLTAIAKELNDLINIGCFEFVEIPSDRKAIASRIVLKVKYRADGTYDKHKARLVAKGFMERLGSDFFSTYSPMASLTTSRALMAIAVHYGLPIFHSDIRDAENANAPLPFAFAFAFTTAESRVGRRGERPRTLHRGLGNRARARAPGSPQLESYTYLVACACNDRTTRAHGSPMA